MQIGYRFGESNQVEILEIINYENIVVKCHVCSEDEEMYGDGKFTSTKYSIKLNRVPCGCSCTYKRNKKQKEIIIKRKLKNTSSEFVEFEKYHDNGKFVITKLHCKDHDTLYTRSYQRFFKDDFKGCDKCVSERKRLPEEYFIDKFKKTTLYKEGVLFKREGERSYDWKYFCPVCANDAFSKEGLCNGWFKTSTTQILKNHMPCRCSKLVFLDKEQKTFQIKSILKEEEKENKVIKLIDLHQSGGLWYYQLRCERHGDFNLDSDLFKRGQRCPLCKVGGFKKGLEAFFYIFTIKYKNKNLVLYGITNNFKIRYRAHKANLIKSGYEISNLKVFKGFGEEIWNFEKSIKQTLPCIDTGIVGFRTESFEMKHYSSTLSLLKNTFESFTDF